MPMVDTSFNSLYSLVLRRTIELHSRLSSLTRSDQRVISSCIDLDGDELRCCIRALGERYLKRYSNQARNGRKFILQSKANGMFIGTMDHITLRALQQRYSIICSETEKVLRFYENAEQLRPDLNWEHASESPNGFHDALYSSLSELSAMYRQDSIKANTLYKILRWSNNTIRAVTQAVVPRLSNDLHVQIVIDIIEQIRQINATCEAIISALTAQTGAYDESAFQACTKKTLVEAWHWVVCTSNKIDLVLSEFESAIKYLNHMPRIVNATGSINVTLADINWLPKGFASIHGFTWQIDLQFKQCERELEPLVKALQMRETMPLLLRFGEETDSKIVAGIFYRFATQRYTQDLSMNVISSEHSLDDTLLWQDRTYAQRVIEDELQKLERT